MYDKTREKEDSAKKGLEVLETIQRKQESERQEKEKKLSSSNISTANKHVSPVPDSIVQQASSNVQRDPSLKISKKSSPGRDSLKSAQSIGTGSVNSHISSKHTNGSVDVDDFVPSFADDVSAGGIDNFLDSEMTKEDSKLGVGKERVAINEIEDSSDDDVIGRGNPMVAKVMDDDSEIEIDEVVNILSPTANIESSQGRLTRPNDNLSSSDDDELSNVGVKRTNHDADLNIPNPLVKKLSNVSISDDSDKSGSSRQSSQKNIVLSDKKEKNADSDDFVFDLKGLPSSNMLSRTNLEENNDSDEKHKKHRKKQKKDKKEKKGSSSTKKGKNVKNEQDDLEEFLNGSISNREENHISDGRAEFAAPEGYDEL